MIADTKKLYKNFFRTYLYIFLIISLAFILRLLFLSEKSLWLDEVYSLIRSGAAIKECSISDAIQNIAENDAHPPLYYILLRFWSKIAILSPEVWLRLLSALFDIAGIFTAYHLFLLLGNKSKAVAGSFILATSSFLIFFAQEARHYSLSNLLAILSSYLIIKIIISNDFRYFLAYLLVVISGFYTYYYLAFLFLTQGLFLLFYGGKEENLLENKQQHNSFWLALKKQYTFFYWIKIQVFATLAFFPWLYYTIPKKLALFQKFDVVARGTITFQDLYNMFLEHLFGTSGAPYIHYYFLFFLVLLTIVFVFHTEKKKFLLFTSWLIAPIIITIFFPYKGHLFQSKHLIFLLPILIGTIVLTIKSNKILIIVATAFLIGNTYSLIHYYPQQKQNFKEAISTLHKNIHQGDIVCFNPYYLESSFLFYYQRQSSQNKQIMPGYTKFNNPEGIPPQQRQFLYINQEDIARAKNKNFWVLEIENCDLAQGEEKLHLWCESVFSKKERYEYIGVLGTIVVTKYFR